jgi:hypothetical protein
MNWQGGGDQHFGNLMGKKADDVCGLAFLNEDTFPALASDPKNETTRATFNSKQQYLQRSHETQEASTGGHSLSGKRKVST